MIDGEREVAARSFTFAARDLELSDDGWTAIEPRTRARRVFGPARRGNCERSQRTSDRRQHESDSPSGNAALREVAQRRGRLRTARARAATLAEEPQELGRLLGESPRVEARTSEGHWAMLMIGAENLQGVVAVRE